MIVKKVEFDSLYSNGSIKTLIVTMRNHLVDTISKKRDLNPFTEHKDTRKSMLEIEN